jgi:hypothetical protein
VDMESSRRKFLFAVGGGVPLILGAANKSGSDKPILGEGDHKYEVTHDWGQLPANIKYGNTHGVCEDSQGRIYVHHTVHGSSESSDTMVVFDSKGKFVKSWGNDFKGGAHGLHIHKEGSQEFLYLCDTKRALVVKTTLNGDEVFTIGYPKESDAYKPDADGKLKKYSPTNLTVTAGGDIYVADGYGSSYVNQYNSKGEYIRTFGGGGGKEAGQLNCPHGIIVDTRGKSPVLAIADRGNNRIQNFTLDGKHIDFVGGTNMPCHFSFNRKNGEVVIPDLAARVTLLDRDNQVILHLGEDASNTWSKLRKEPREKFIPGKFVCPHGACFDHSGNIFVVEWVDVGRVSRLRKVA